MMSTRIRQTGRTEYSFWAASSVWKQYLVTGDRDFVVGQLDNLVKQYRGCGTTTSIPASGSTGRSLSGMLPSSPLRPDESSDPYHGGAGFRPTINAYQYGDARAISSIATLKGNTALASEV